MYINSKLNFEFSSLFCFRVTWSHISVDIGFVLPGHICSVDMGLLLSRCGVNLNQGTKTYVKKTRTKYDRTKHWWCAMWTPALNFTVSSEVRNGSLTFCTGAFLRQCGAWSWLKQQLTEACSLTIYISFPTIKSTRKLYTAFTDACQDCEPIIFTGIPVWFEYEEEARFFICKSWILQAAARRQSRSELIFTVFIWIGLSLGVVCLAPSPNRIARIQTMA